MHPGSGWDAEGSWGCRQAERPRGALLSALVVVYVGCSHSLIYKGCTASVGTCIRLVL